MTAQIIQFPSRSVGSVTTEPFEAYVRYLEARRSIRSLPRFTRESVQQFRVWYCLTDEETERLQREEEQYRPLED